MRKSQGKTPCGRLTGLAADQSRLYHLDLISPSTSRALPPRATGRCPISGPQGKILSLCRTAAFKSKIRQDSFPRSGSSARQLPGSFGLPANFINHFVQFSILRPAQNSHLPERPQGPAHPQTARPDRVTAAPIAVFPAAEVLRNFSR